MDYYASVVIDYLRANRSTFVNTEYCIQLNPGNPDTSGSHWYCDAVALDLSAQTTFLCEISYADHLDALTKRLHSWHANWSTLCTALARDSTMETLGHAWLVRPWLFIRQERIELLLKN